MFTMTPMLLAFAIFATVSCELEKRGTSVTDDGNYVTTCKNAPIELAIIMDGSRSVRVEDFNKGMVFLQDFVQKFTIDGNDESTRVSFITFATELYTSDGFLLNQYTSMKAVVSALRRIRHRETGATLTHLAIKYMRKQLLSARLVRKDVPKVCIVVTDGRSNDKASFWKSYLEKPMYKIETLNMQYVNTKDTCSLKSTENMLEDFRQIMLKEITVKDEVEHSEAFRFSLSGLVVEQAKTAEQARLARQVDNITMIAIGVGNHYDLSELHAIAGSDTRVSTVTSYSKLKSIEGLIVKQSCIRTEKKYTDILFVFSPCDLGLEGNRWATDFMNQARAFKQHIAGEFYFGAVTGKCPESKTLPFTNDTAVLDNFINDYNKEHLVGLVQTAEANGFDASNGARGKAKKVVVLIVSQLPTQGLNTLTSTFKKLTGRGIKIFVSSVAGNKVSLPVARVLQGTTMAEQAQNLLSAIEPKKHANL